MSADPKDMELAKRVLSRPILFPQEFNDWLQDWFATNIPKLPVKQVFGFKLHTARSATDVLDVESTSSTSYTNLATVGPTVDKLPNGFYIVLFGARAGNFVAGGNNRYMSISIDGAAASDNNAGVSLGGFFGRIVLVDLSTGNNQHEIKAKYRVAGGTWSFSNRWLHALRVATDV